MSDNKSCFDAQQFIATVSDRPGVYIFTDKQGDTLYVGKAKNLKKRLQSYFRSTGLTPKTRLMVSKIAHAQTQQTRTESEALLLEYNLIKDKRPYYNITLRDGKSFPYIRLTEKDTFPRFTFYRGHRTLPGRYYGPYPNSAAVREMLAQLQKIFRLRQCDDAFFRNRSRPCLQYQIKRCSAPCTGRISPEDYREDIRQAKAMLAGEDTRLVDELAEKMEQASDNLDYENAAVHRDRISLLQRIREKQYISSDARDADVVAVAAESGMVCFGVTSIRHGRNLGIRFHLQPNALDKNPSELLEVFLAQNYFGSAMPREILLSEAIDSRSSLQQIFTVENKRKVVIKQRCRSYRARWIESARLNVADHLNRHLNQRSQISDQFNGLCDFLSLAETPSRIECFDISHTMGERTVGACVVFDHNGPVKSDYRRYNISGIEPGDDYAAMGQVLTRRYKKVLENDGRIPDLVIIDGGKGQLDVARKVFEELQILDSVVLMGVSKGPERKAGKELFHLVGVARPFQPAGTSPVSHLVQRIRDEAHRFALTGHRLRRGRARNRSALEQIAGIGDKRRRNLLRYFGGIREIKRAGVEDIAKVPGISVNLAQRIFNDFHQ